MDNQCSLEYQAIINSLDFLSKEELFMLEHELDKRLHVCSGCKQIVKSIHACPGVHTGNNFYPEYILTLEKIDSKLPVMKILREYFTLSLNDMQIALHNLPYTVMSSTLKSEIDFFKKKFEDVGATVKITFCS